MENKRFAFINGPLEVINLKPDNTINNKSVAAIFLSGKNKKVLNTRCCAEYKIIEGKGTFTIWNDKNRKIINVEKGSVVKIEKDTPYQDEGDMVMISTYNPPFTADQLKILED